MTLYFSHFRWFCGLLYYAASFAFSMQWALVFVPAVASSICWLLVVVLHQSGIVLVYDLLNIRHGTVADFDGVAVEDLSERVVCCK